MICQDTLLQSIQNGFHVDSGISRRVLAISDKVVVKMYHGDYFDGQQEHEMEFYRLFGERFGSLIPQMYGWLETEDYGLLLFMERVQPLYLDMDIESYIWRNLAVNEARETLEALNDLIHETGLCDVMCNELNWGLREDGSLVCLDCGYSNGQYMT